jgi:hypothetical protein
MVHGGTHLSGSGSDSNSACEQGGTAFAFLFMVPEGRASEIVWVGGMTSQRWSWALLYIKVSRTCALALCTSGGALLAGGRYVDLGQWH